MLPKSEVSGDIHSVEGGKSWRRPGPPLALSFEQVVKNTVASPCSLGEFMDFLVYSDLNAELLQFFIWYCDYIERWSELSPRQKSLSPPWEHVRHRGQKGPAAQTHRRDGSDRLNQILNIMEVMNSKKRPSWPLGERSDEGVGSGTLSESPSTLSAPAPAALKAPCVTNQDAQRGEPIALPLNSNPVDKHHPDKKQPFRDEVNMIMEQYVSDQAPRRLKISDEDLAACQKAASLTTHPSAFLRAFTVAEDHLKSDCYPRFVRNSQRNANKPRLVFVRVLTLIVIMMGFLANQVMVLSSLSQFYRVLSIILWWPSFTTFIASVQGLCIILQLRSLRQLRPWEQEQLLDDVEAGCHAHEPGAAAEATKHTGSKKDRQRPKQAARGMTSRNDDALRKPSMQTFGPANKYRRRAFVKAYQSKPMIRKVWDDAVKTRNRDIKMLQDRTLFLSICWGGAVSSVLTVVSLFIPVMKVI